MTTLELSEDECWAAVRARDKAFDGRFLIGVMTTGVFCRPSCPSRPALRKNVRFFANAEDAHAAGLRACLRCRPLALTGSDPNTKVIQDVCEYVRAHAGETLALAELARHAGLSPFHFQRSFRAVMGVTPKQFVGSCRMGVFKDRLRGEGSVTDAIYEAGFGSSSRLYERVDTALGMTPVEYRAGGRGVAITYVATPTVLGLMMLGATDRGLCFLQFGDDEEALRGELAREYPQASIEAMQRPYSAQFEAWIEALTAHLAGGQPRLDLPLDLRATAFQTKVWKYLQSIPYGRVDSYAEVAAALGQPAATRAVANACAKNRVALVIPCHRVIRGTGELGGYRWGVERKRVLIDRERAAR